MNERELNSIQNDLDAFQKQLLQFSNRISGLQHKDLAVSLSLRRMKQSSLQILDVFSTLNKQIYFTKNELREFDRKEQLKQNDLRSKR
jgi:hypothetical protein